MTYRTTRSFERQPSLLELDMKIYFLTDAILALIRYKESLQAEVYYCRENHE